MFARLLGPFSLGATLITVTKVHRRRGNFLGAPFPRFVASFSASGDKGGRHPQRWNLYSRRQVTVRDSPRGQAVFSLRRHASHGGRSEKLPQRATTWARGA